MIYRSPSNPELLKTHFSPVRPESLRELEKHNEIISHRAYKENTNEEAAENLLKGKRRFTFILSIRPQLLKYFTYRISYVNAYNAIKHKNFYLDERFIFRNSTIYACHTHETTNANDLFLKIMSCSENQIKDRLNLRSHSFDSFLS